jgi:hypothetical protein
MIVRANARLAIAWISATLHLRLIANDNFV